MMLPPKVRVACDGMFTHVLGPNGESFEATHVRFVHEAGTAPKVILEMCAVPFDVEDVVVLYEMFDPNSHQRKTIRAIYFSDGSAWYAPVPERD